MKKNLNFVLVRKVINNLSNKPSYASLSAETEIRILGWCTVRNNNTVTRERVFKKEKKLKKERKKDSTLCWRMRISHRLLMYRRNFKSHVTPQIRTAVNRQCTVRTLFLSVRVPRRKRVGLHFHREQNSSCTGPSSLSHTRIFFLPFLFLFFKTCSPTLAKDMSIHY